MYTPTQFFKEAAMTGEAAATHKTHPLIIVAAGAVTLLCAAAIASIMGWLPGANSSSAPVASAPLAVQPSTAAPQAASPAPDARPWVAEAPAVSQATSPAAASPAPVVLASAATTQTPTPTYAEQGNAPPLAPVAPPPVRKVCRNCGTISSITAIEKQGESSGTGAVIGGVVGGVAGHQAGRGRGKDVATVAGVLGGALIGNAIEKSKNKSLSYDIRVRMEDGTYRTLRYASQSGYRTGDRVRIENGRLVLR